MEPTAAQAKQRSGSLWRLWPMWMFIVVALLFDLFSTPLVLQFQSSGPLNRNLVICLVIGSVIGQACIICLLGGLWGRSWLSGYMLAVALATIGTFLFMLGEELTYRSQFDLSRRLIPIFAGTLVVPAFVLAGVSPMLFFRGRYGWRLTRRNEEGNKAQNWGVEELLIGTAVTAAAINVATSASKILQVPPYQILMGLGIFSLVIAAASLMGVIPAVWILFRIDDRKRRIAFLGLMIGVTILLTVITTVLVNVVIQASSSAAPGRGTVPPLSEAVLYALGLSIFSAIMCLAGMTAIKLSGYQLFRSIQASAVSANAKIAHPSPLIDAEPLKAVRIDRNAIVHRSMAGLILGVAFLVNIATSSLVQSRVSGVAELQKQALALGLQGSLRIDSNNDPVEIRLAPYRTLDDLAGNTSLEKVYSLSLANCRFVDDDIPKLTRFKALRILELEGTQITNEGLTKLANHQIEQIGLARTNITYAGFEGFLQRTTARVFDIRELEIYCHQLAEMKSLSKIGGLRLGPAQVDNAGLSKLLTTIAKLTDLDVTDCEIDETAFSVSKSRSYGKLVLDGTKVTDVKFASMLSTLSCRELSLSRTALTDAILPSLALAKGVTGLKLGETNITEAGLSAAQIQNLTKLALNGKHFTGECFSDWHPSALGNLDLSHSGVTDQALRHLAALPSIRLLNLANTKITDTGLAQISGISSYAIDLRGTKVTAAGLCDHKIAGRNIYIDLNQFTPEEIRRISNNVRLTLGRQFPW